MQGGEWKCVEQVRDWNRCADVKRETVEGVMYGDVVVVPEVEQRLGLHTCTEKQHISCIYSQRYEYFLFLLSFNNLKSRLLFSGINY